MSTPFSSKFKIGSGLAWFRPSITGDLKVLLGSNYTNDTVPDEVFNVIDFCWSLSGIFLGTTETITIKPNFTTTTDEADFVNAPTGDWFENQSLDISLKLNYNGITDVTDLFELPELGAGGEYVGGTNIQPYYGSLLILESNLRNSLQELQHIVRCRLYYNCKVTPRAITINGGHTDIDADFSVRASIDPATGCYRTSTYHRWTTSIYAPNTLYMPNGNAVNTDADLPFIFDEGIEMNL